MVFSGITELYSYNNTELYCYVTELYFTTSRNFILKSPGTFFLRHGTSLRHGTLSLRHVNLLLQRHGTLCLSGHGTSFLRHGTLFYIITELYPYNLMKHYSYNVTELYFTSRNFILRHGTSSLNVSELYSYVMEYYPYVT